MRTGSGVPRLPIAAVFAAVLFCGSVSSALLAPRQAPAERFDNQVRADMFAGFSGDAVALDRAMKLSEETLAKDRENAQALVWHGSGSIFLGGQAMRGADYARGAPLLAKGFREMDDAVAKVPDRAGVRIPRTIRRRIAREPSLKKAWAITSGFSPCRNCIGRPCRSTRAAKFFPDSPSAGFEREIHRKPSRTWRGS